MCLLSNRPKDASCYTQTSEVMKVRGVRTPKILTEAQSQRKTISRLGTVSPLGNGWRVAAAPTRRLIYGPYRVHKRRAYADLKQARAANSREEYRSILVHLKQTAPLMLAPYCKVYPDLAQAQLLAKRLRNLQEATHISKPQRCIARSGIVSHHSNGWRVAAAPTGHLIYGPYRTHRREADADLKEVRTAKTRQEYRNILLRLKKEARATACRKIKYGAPKGDRKQTSLLGTSTYYDAGWRVVVKIEGRLTYGPYRMFKSDADDDLKQAREAESREEFRNILLKLRKSKQHAVHDKKEEDDVTVEQVEETSAISTSERSMRANCKSYELKGVRTQTEKTRETLLRNEKNQNDKIVHGSMKQRSDDEEDTQSRKRARFELNAGGKLRPSRSKSDDVKVGSRPTEKTQELQLGIEKAYNQESGNEPMELDAVSVYGRCSMFDQKSGTTH